MARDLTRSPFPGMDPYLEQYWGDVHHRLCTYACDLLRKSLPAGLISRIDERTIIQDEFDVERTIIPDVRVMDYGGKAGGVATAAPATPQPIILDAGDEYVTEGFVQVIDTRNGNRIITVIEFTSPANKISTEGRKMYHQKSLELIGGGVSLVEVDFIRAGAWNLRAPLAKVEYKGRGLYNVCVTRGWRYKKPEIYPIQLKDRLPLIAIPLRPTDPDVVVDLQVLIDQVYENGSYGYDVDYSKPPVPPLPDSENKWAEEFLPSKLS